jgi:hypothetical protein
MAKPVLVVAPLIVAEGRRYSPIIGGGYMCETGTWRNSPVSYAYQWYRNGVLISGANQQTYTPIYEDERWPLQCKVTATNADGSTETWADDDTAKVVEGALPPYVIQEPILNYTEAVVDGTVTCDPGQWGGASTINFKYQWRRNGDAIPGAVNQTYTFVAADEDLRVSCLVTAYNDQGSAWVISHDTDPVSPAVYIPPANTVAPVVSGQPYVGQTLSCSTGTWTGDTPITYTRQWFRDGGAIPGAVNSTYVVQTADANTTIHCEVTGTNPGGSATASSNDFGPIVSAPVNSVAPAISGTPEVGQTLSCTTGTWSPTGTYAYQWRRNGANIGGAVSNTYVLQLTDVGTNITCAVTATNLSGSTTAVSNTLGPILDSATLPVNTVAPVVSGVAEVGATLTCTTGTWTGTTPITYDYRWYRAAPTYPADPIVEPIPYGEPSYIVGEEDVGFNIFCEVTATNRAGSAQAVSNGFLIPVPTYPPEIATAPVVSGTPTVGQTLSCTTGSWNGTAPFTYAYQWKRNGTAISGATAATYALVSADYNTTITCDVTATNSAGSATASSNSLGPVQGVAPANTILPAITGTARVGQTLSCSTGTWTGAPAPTYAYQWKRGGVDISGATNSTYALVEADYTTTITCTVTATNAIGSNAATSNPTAAVGASIPANTVAPVVSGGDSVGATLTCTDGTWTGYPAPTFTKQWYRVDILDNEYLISGATGDTYVLQTTDEAYDIRCKVTGSNAGGNTTASSNTIGPVTAPGLVYVGGKTAGYAGSVTGYNITHDGLTGGIATSPQEGDLCVAFIAAGSTADLSLTISGQDGEANYTYIETELYSNSTYDANLRMAYRFMDGVETRTTFTAATSISGIVVGVRFYRNVDPATVLDVAAVTATGTLTAAPNAPEITPVTPGAVIVVTGASGHNQNTITNPFSASDLTGFLSQTGNDDTDCAAGFGHKLDWSSGAFDPAPFTFNGSASNFSAWCAETIVLRPKFPGGGGSVIAPTNTAAPTVVGTPALGAATSCNEGTWTGNPAPWFTYQWLKNDVVIPGATSKTYTPVAGDVGATLKCQVTAYNAAGSAVATSTASDPVVEKLSLVYVGGMTGGQAGGATSMQIDFALTGGIDTLPRAGDIVVVAQNWANGADVDFTFMANQTAGRGYTQLADLYSNDTYDTNLYAGYKIMGDVPDTFVNFGANNDATSGMAYAIHVWRNVEPDNPLDVDVVTNTGTNTGYPVSQSITTLTPGAVCIFMAAAAAAAASPQLFINDGLSNFLAAFGNSTNDAHIGMGSKLAATAGAIDDGSWTYGPTSNNANSNANCYLALRVKGAKPEGIYFVGSKTGQNGGSIATRTVALDNLTGGFAAKPAPGDIVFLILGDVCNFDLDTTRAVQSPGWTAMNELYANDTRDTNMQMFYKVMGDVVDADVTFNAATDASDGAWMLYVIGGVDPTTPLDVNPTTNTGLNLGQPNPPAITPANAGAKVLAVGAASGGVSLSSTFTTTELSNFATFREDDGSVAIILGAGLMDWSGSGAVDPVSFGGGSTSTSDCWVSRTTALRLKGATTPRPPANTTAPAITGNTTVGSVLTCSPGTWSGYPAPTFAYQWTLDGVDIAGAVASTYTSLAGDAGKTVACRVTATNSEGSASATAAGVVITTIAAPNLIGTANRNANTSFSHEVVAGTKCLIVRGIVGNDSTASTLATCTWNGQAMTRIRYASGTAGSRTAACALFYLMNPTPGTGDVVIAGAATDIYSAENWANVSGIGDNNATGDGTNRSSFSHTFTKTNPLNVLINVGILRVGTEWTPGADNTEEYDADLGTWGRAYFGSTAGSTSSASCAGGANTFSAISAELIAG